MITHQIFAGPAQRIQLGQPTGGTFAGFASACGTRDAALVEKGQTSGYAHVIWRIACPLNPPTGKPAAESDKVALNYLHTTSACHASKLGHPCR